ncbi:MAG: hypothetical protein A2Y89_04675 [Chloroflexi bacterium RBG_13_51_18]|nr:MAG: hypothetical protein A2Y89_04675 [Chloroflexi bacterium RBG_13_51_18]
MERKIRIPLQKATKNAILIIVPLSMYVAAIWLSYGFLGWQIALFLAIVFPIILFVPVLIWISVISGLADVVRDRLRRRANISRRRALKRAGALSPNENEYTGS